MGGKSGALVIRFVGDMRDLDRTTVKVSKSMSAVGKVGRGLAIGAGLAAAAIGSIAVKTTQDLMRVERLGKATENVIRATGGAAGRTRSQVDRMASRLERMSGAEAETVTEGQNMLLTFKNIKGKQFDEATKSMLDMGVAMNKGSLKGLDLQKTSILMGKALNDPIKGLTALSRVGVSFTDQQKKQITRMQEAGDVAGAQKVILKELKSEFGGAAKAAGQTTEGMMAKIENTFGNVAEKVFSFVLPMIAKFADWVNVKAMPAVERFAGWLSGPGATYLAAFGEGLKRIGGWISGTLVPSIASMGRWIVRNKDWLSALAVTFSVFTAGILVYKGVTLGVMKAQLAWAAITKGVAAAQMALNVALSANPIGLIILAVAALVAGLVWFFTKTKTGQKIVRSAWRGIKAAISGVTNWWTKTAWPAIKRGASAVGNAFRSLGRWTRSVWNGIGDAIGRAWRWVNRNVFRPFKLGLRILGLAFRIAGAMIGRMWRAAVGRVMDGWRWVNRNVFRPFKLGLRILGLAFRSAGALIGRLWNRVGSAIGNVWRRYVRPVFTRLKNFVTRDIPQGFRNGVDKVERFWGRIKKVAKGPVRFVVGTIWNDGLRKMINAIPGVKNIKETKLGFRSGGAVFGPGTSTSDSIPARLSKNEHVWTAAEVRAAGGHKQMERMRRAVVQGKLYGGDPKFAKGGGLTSAQVARGQSFARSQMGKPYGWGAVGPSSYDCSGFMSALTNVIRGKYPHSRVGSTASFPWGGFEPGPGQFTIGSSSNFSGGIGHMAGNLAGMGVESRGGTGVIVGSGAMSPSRFSKMYHLGAGGALSGGGGGGFDFIGLVKTVLNAVRKLPGQISEMMAKGGWIVSLMKKMAGNLWSKMATWINKKIPDWGPIPDNPIPRKFAQGGRVRRKPGGTLALLGDGTHDEWISPMRPGGGGPGGGTIVIPVYLGGKVIETIIVDTVRKTAKTKGGGSVQKAFGRGVG